MTNDEFNKAALELIAKELQDQRYFSTQVLFGIEVDAADWTPEAAVSALFRYASKAGWDIDEDNPKEMI